MTEALARFSDALAETVAKAAPSVVRVEARRRIPASGIVWSANGTIVTAIDQQIGTGDGANRLFPLTKTYADAGGATVRRIEKPVEGSIVTAVDGLALDPTDFAVDPTTGLVTIAAAATPGPGAVVTAGYEFDIPVRFDTDRIEISLAAFRAGSVPSVPLVEIRP